MRVSICAGMSAAIVLLAGCAHSVPQTDLVRADLAVEQASLEEAGQYAPTQLSEAERKLQQARDASFEGNYAAAQKLAQEALAAAQLARAEADSRRVEQLVEESRRSTKTPGQQQSRTEVSQ